MAKAKPLKGRLILDCANLLPGSFAAKLLALQGARVLKIENPNRPDPVRRMPHYFRDLNDCKEWVPIDIERDRGRERFRDLVRKAHGLIEGFRPLTKTKLGLDEETLHSINPRLCIASIVGYPETGRWKDRPGHDLNFEAVTGCLSLFTEMPGLPLGFFFSSYSAALALTASMDAVARGAKGRRVVISLAETLLDAQSGLAREYRQSGRLPRHGETLFSGKFPCYRLYEAKDGRGISVGCIENKFWLKFCEVIGLPELAQDAFSEGKRAERVGKKVQEALGRKSWKYWAPLFDEAACCVEPVLDYSEVFRGKTKGF